MPVILDFEKLPSRGRVTVWWAQPNAFANPSSPTAAELNSPLVLKLSKSLSWSDYGFGVQASNTESDPSFADVGNVQSRGASQYGGEMSFFSPYDDTDLSNIYKLVEDVMAVQRSRGFVVIRIDGDTKTTVPAATGDFIHVFETLIAGETNAITGESSFRYTINMLQQGFLEVNTLVGGLPAATPVVITPSATPVTVGKSARLTATVAGRDYTNGLRWTSSDSSKVAIHKGGVYTPIAAGTATITATFEQNGATATQEIVVA